jgi:excisionase family DNA binding protein
MIEERSSRLEPSKPMQATSGQSARPAATTSDASSIFPITVKEAARFLGVSTQTVYLWVERKQIPHLRVMGRNIRFLKSDLEPFRAQFKHEVENGKTA